MLTASLASRDDVDVALSSLQSADPIWWLLSGPRHGERSMSSARRPQYRPQNARGAGAHPGGTDNAWHADGGDEAGTRDDPGAEGGGEAVGGGNVRASGYERIAADFYVEPRWIVDAFLDMESLKGPSWDPACGAGNIPLVLQARGMSCWGSDIVDRGFGTTGLDFFAAPETAVNIISNPPYGVIEPFIRRALEKTTGKVCVLARLALLEGVKRRSMFQETPLARVWVSSRRVSMPPGNSSIEAKGGAIAYAWFVWDHAHVGKATIEHL